MKIKKSNKKNQIIKIKKDLLDYVYYIGMLVFTGLIAYSALKIPHEIEKSNIRFRNYSNVEPQTIGPRIPYMIYGKFTLRGVIKENVNITLTNLFTNEQLSDFTNFEGVYEFNLDGLPHYFQYGDELSIKACIKQMCTEKHSSVIGKSQGIEIDFDIN